MIILVDGYNVLKQIHDGEMISEQQRRSFIKQLASYQRIRSHKKIIVIFDGGPDPWPSQEKIRGITVIYAGADQTADDYIHSFMREHKAKAANMLLVSSDRQLATWASNHGVASIDAYEFYKLMLQALKPLIKVPKGQEAVKMTEESFPELDALMREAAGQIMPKKEDWAKEAPEAKQGKLSKAERALLKKSKSCSRTEDMDVAKLMEREGCVIFGKDHIPEVVDYLYDQLKDCKIMAFSGPLGAGKTTLIRALLRKCGITEPITSPTFIYVNRYKNDQDQVFYHFDLYRIESVSDFLEAGFDEYFEQPNSWCFIEWPEVIKAFLPEKSCYIKLDYHDDKRELRIK